MRQAVAGNHPAILELIRALGIDTEGLISVDLRFSFDEVAATTTTLKRLFSGEEADNAATTVRRWKFTAEEVEGNQHG